MKKAAAVIIIGTVLNCSSLLWAGEDEDAITVLLLDSAKVTADFSRTRDAQSVLKMYSPDYAGVQDGEEETIETVRRWLAEYGAELDKGSPLRYLGEVFGVKVHVSGQLAWATYDYVFSLVSKGEIQTEDRGRCTSILRKEGTTWLIRHEHCSKAKPTD